MDSCPIVKPMTGDMHHQIYWWKPEGGVYRSAMFPWRYPIQGLWGFSNRFKWLPFVSKNPDVSENLEKQFMITGCQLNGMEISFMISQAKMLLDMQWAPTWEICSRRLQRCNI